MQIHLAFLWNLPAKDFDLLSQGVDSLDPCYGSLTCQTEAKACLLVQPRLSFLFPGSRFAHTHTGADSVR